MIGSGKRKKEVNVNLIVEVIVINCKFDRKRIFNELSKNKQDLNHGSIIIWTNGKDFVFCLLLNNNRRREKMTIHRKVRFDGILLWILLWLDLLD